MTIWHMIRLYGRHPDARSPCRQHATGLRHTDNPAPQRPERASSAPTAPRGILRRPIASPPAPRPRQHAEHVLPEPAAAALSPSGAPTPRCRPGLTTQPRPGHRRHARTAVPVRPRRQRGGSRAGHHVGLRRGDLRRAVPGQPPGRPQTPRITAGRHRRSDRGGTPSPGRITSWTCAHGNPEFGGGTGLQSGGTRPERPGADASRVRPGAPEFRRLHGVLPGCGVRPQPARPGT